MNAALKTLSIATAVLALGACSDSDTDVQADLNTEFSLNFVAQAGDEPVNCDTQLMGFGAEGHYSVAVNDLRFYVSNVKMYDMDGNVIESAFDDNDFQLNHEQGFVGLVDLTSNSSGACASDAIQHSEGTARTNAQLTGVMAANTISKISFDLGVPQAVMKAVINNTTAEDAPSPLNEMYWSWASGYRHFVMNFGIENMHGMKGEGYIHLGSRGCGGEGLLALEGKESCDLVNTPKVELSNFDIHNQSVVLDLHQVLTGLAFTMPMMHGDNNGHNHGGHNNGDNGAADMMAMPSVTCHSADPSMQPDCGPIFENFGMNNSEGTALSANNQTMTMQ